MSRFFKTKVTKRKAAKVKEGITQLEATGIIFHLV